MISFDQVLLLEEKVESAVKKIEQLNAENAALRSKCAELSNALAAKSEQFSSFESNQSKIEEGILKALSRLNAVENVVLSAAQTSSVSKQAAPIQSDSLSNSENQPVESLPQNDASESPVSSNEVSSEPVFTDPAASNQESSIPQTEVQPAATSSGVQSDDSTSSSFTPEVDFEFGESDSDAGVSPLPAENQNPARQEADSSQQPMFDIF